MDKLPTDVTTEIGLMPDNIGVVVEPTDYRALKPTSVIESALATDKLMTR